MKKILLAILMAVCLLGCTKNEPVAEEKPLTITSKINLNIMEEPADMRGYVWLEDESPAFAEIEFAESIRLFAEEGSGVLLISRTGCPWCQRAIPVLNDVAKELGVTVYYVNVERSISDDPVEGQAIFQTLVSYIESTFETDDEGTPIFQIPLVIGVKNGEITGHHLSLVEGFTLSSEDAQMDEKQTEHLKDLYREIFRSVAD